MIVPSANTSRACFVARNGLTGFLAAVCASGFLQTSAESQSVPGWRIAEPRKQPYERQDGEFGWLFILTAGTSQNLTWYRDNPPPANLVDPEDSILLPFDAVGSFHPHAAVADSYLLSGVDRASTTGKISLVRMLYEPQRHLEIAATRELPGVDPWRITWSPVDQALYVVDGLGGRLLRAPWTGQLPLPTSFVSVVDSASLPDLSYIDHGGAAWGFGSRAGGGVTFGGQKITFDITYQGNQWTVTPQTFYQFLQTTQQERYRVRSQDLTNAEGPITMQGPTGTFELVELESGTVRGTGSIAAAGEWFAFQPPTALRPGVAHFIRGGTPQQQSETFWPLARYGQPGVNGGLLLGRGIAKLGYHRVGNALFSVGTDLRVLMPAPSFQFTAQTWLWVAVTFPQQPPPIVQIGDDTVLIAGATLGPYPIPLSSSETVGVIGVPLPIPDESGLEGCRVYGQFASVAPGDATVLSDVFAVEILGAAGSAAAQGSAAPSAAARRRAVQRFVRGIGASTDLASYRQLLERLRR